MLYSDLPSPMIHLILYHKLFRMLYSDLSEWCFDTDYAERQSGTFCFLKKTPCLLYIIQLFIWHFLSFVPSYLFSLY